MTKPLAVIVGAGSGLSASVARALAPDYDLLLTARTGARMADVAEETGADTIQMDASDAEGVAELFAGLAQTPRVVMYNPSARVRGPLTELAPAEVRHAIDVTAFGAFLVGQAAAKRMLDADPDASGKRGTILFTGASAGVKGFPQSAPFAMGKFAQRGLAQSMSRELHPQGIHVAWVNIDGGIRNEARPERVDAPGEDRMLDPDAIAQTYLHLINQHRSAWSEEVAVRPWVERF